jgi:hypothetical protein
LIAICNECCNQKEYGREILNNNAWLQWLAILNSANIIVSSHLKLSEEIFSGDKTYLKTGEKIEVLASYTFASFLDPKHDACRNLSKLND